MLRTVKKEDVWNCDVEDIQKVIDFVVDLEANEEQMADGAAMMVTCEQNGISYEKGYDLLTCLPSTPYPWWADADDISPEKRLEIIDKAIANLEAKNERT